MALHQGRTGIERVGAVRTRNLEAALELLDHGWSLVPLKPRSKRPLVAWRRFTERQPSEAEAVTWWREWPDAGLALVTGWLSGVIAIDIDPRNGGRLDALPDVPSGPVSESGRGDGGRHYLLAHPGEYVTSGPIGSGIDLIGDGHLLVLPPSLHPATGQPYRWVVAP